MGVRPAARITLLDGFAVRLGAKDPQWAAGDLPHAVQRLVAHLCFTRKIARTAVAGLLWPDVAEERAHGSLRSALWRLHKEVPGLIEGSGDSLALADGVEVDVRELSEWARRVLDGDTGPDNVALPDPGLQGELLPGWYEDWVLLERERLQQLRMHSLEVVAERLAAAGRHGEALEAAYAAVRADPLRESAHRAVVRVHLAEGNMCDAVRTFERFRALLESELGVGPSAQMTGLVIGLRGRRVVGGCAGASSSGSSGMAGRGQVHAPSRR